MMYTRSQNYTNMVVGKHGIQTFVVVVVVLLLLLLPFDIFVPTSAQVTRQLSCVARNLSYIFRKSTNLPV